MQKYAVVSSWDRDGTSTRKGIGLYRMDDDGGLTLCQNILSETKIATVPTRDSSGNLYFCEEVAHAHGVKAGGGGYIVHVRLEEGRLNCMGFTPSLSSAPSGSAITTDERLLLVSHHTARVNAATVLRRNAEGRLLSELVYDTPALVLFHLEENGLVGQAIDFDEHDPAGNRRSFLHGVFRNPEKNLFFVPDKGLDRLYCYAVEDERLVLRDTLEFEAGTDPRYVAFHAQRRVLYLTCEQRQVLYTISYDGHGRMRVLGKEPLLGGGGCLPKVMASDVAIHPNQHHVYVILRGLDQIVTLRVGTDYVARRMGAVPCGGAEARGLAISPDGLYLYCCNTFSDTIARFAIDGDGTLDHVGDTTCSRPGSMLFV